MHAALTWPELAHCYASRRSSPPLVQAANAHRQRLQPGAARSAARRCQHQPCGRSTCAVRMSSGRGSSSELSLSQLRQATWRSPLSATTIAASRTEAAITVPSAAASGGDRQPPAQIQLSMDAAAAAAATAASAPETSGKSQQHVLADGEVIEYKDSRTDIAFIAVVRRAYARIAGWQSDRAWNDGPESYMGMVEVSKALMKGRTADQQLAAVISGFPKVPALFRRLFPYSKWGAELNARITPAFFTWLVGPMTTVEVDIDGVTQSSGVYIKRCRYLAESGCAGMCVNLCKRPTQAFFTEQLGMPLMMEPNFDDYSCEMVFGRRPPLPDEDPAFKQGCLAVCSTAQAAGKAGAMEKACHKLE